MVEGGGVITLSWDQNNPTPDNQTPPPTNLRIDIAAGAASTGAQASSESFTPAETCPLVGWNIYFSTNKPVEPIPQNLVRFVPATDPFGRRTNVPTTSAESNYVITAVYRCNNVPKESDPSNEVGVPVGGRVDSVRAGGKLKIFGGGFTDSVEVFVDGVSFRKRAKVNGGNIVQKGALSNGKPLAEVFVAGRTYIITVRNSNNGIASYNYTPQ
jgi:hypothetical protein